MDIELLEDGKKILFMDCLYDTDQVIEDYESYCIDYGSIAFDDYLFRRSISAPFDAFDSYGHGYGKNEQDDCFLPFKIVRKPLYIWI